MAMISHPTALKISNSMAQCKQGGSEKAKEAAKVPGAGRLKATFAGARITNSAELRTPFFMGNLALLKDSGGA